jgi:group I intron endonuclease
MSQGIIYLIINKQNGHKYIGQTTQGMNKRWQQHIQESLRMSNTPLHKAMRKYGNHNFMIKEIDECDESLLNEKEQYWIEKYNTFNSTDGYNGDHTHNTDDEVIQETLKPKEKINRKTEPWGFLISKNRGDGKHSGIKIQGLNIETGEIREWDNARDAAEEITGDRNKNSNILLSAKKGYKCYGYRWKLLENKNKKKAIKAVNRITWQEYHFESCADAIRKVCGNQCKGTGLYKALKSKGRYTWKNHMWFYL